MLCRLEDVSAGQRVSCVCLNTMFLGFGTLISSVACSYHFHITWLAFSHDIHICMSHLTFAQFLIVKEDTKTWSFGSPRDGENPLSPHFQDVTPRFYKHSITYAHAGNQSEILLFSTLLFHVLAVLQYHRKLENGKIYSPLGHPRHWRHCRGASIIVISLLQNTDPKVDFHQRSHCEPGDSWCQ